jgi:hypothetical protein
MVMKIHFFPYSHTYKNISHALILFCDTKSNFHIFQALFYTAFAILFMKSSHRRVIRNGAFILSWHFYLSIISVSSKVLRGSMFPLWVYAPLDYNFIYGSRDRVVGIVTGYWLDNRWIGVRVPAVSRFFSSPCCPGRLWSPLSLLSIGHREFFLRGEVARTWS